MQTSISDEIRAFDNIYFLYEIYVKRNTVVVNNLKTNIYKFTSTTTKKVKIANLGSTTRYKTNLTIHRIQFEIMKHNKSFKKTFDIYTI